MCLFPVWALLSCTPVVSATREVFAHSCVFNSHLPAFNNRCFHKSILLAWASVLHAPPSVMSPTQTHTPYEAFYLKHLLILKGKPFVNSVCLDTRRSLGEIQRDCVRFWKLNSRDGDGGSRLRPQSTLLLGNHSNKPELRWYFLYLSCQIMMPLLAAVLEYMYMYCLLGRWHLFLLLQECT